MLVATTVGEKSDVTQHILPARRREPDNNPHQPLADNAMEARGKATKGDIAQQEEASSLEFPYRLSCPGQVLQKTNYSVILGYHVGLLRNWKAVVRDQLHTLAACGLGRALDAWFVSYSGDAATRHDLEQVFAEYAGSVPVPPQFFASTGVPWEGTMLNTLNRYCQVQPQLPQSTKPTVVFYWHTKGTSRWNVNWREHLAEPYTYSRVLYWRKYMEYFLHERPAHCVDRIVNRGAYTCGVHRQPKRGTYGGNFWAASCPYLVTLPLLNITTPAVDSKKKKKSVESGYFQAEDVFGQYQNDSSPNSPRFVSLHQPSRRLKGFYYRLMEPSEYATAIANWGPAV